MSRPSTSGIRSEAGVFSSVDGARRAVFGLLNAGFTSNEITVICSDDTKERYFREFEHQHPAGSNTVTAALTGGTIGAALGGVTAIASSSAVGAMALWAAGPIAAIAGAGAVLGGLVGAMMTRGVEKEAADFYQQAVLSGDILVTAEHEGPDHEPRLKAAAEVFAQAGAKPLPLREG